MGEMLPKVAIPSGAISQNPCWGLGLNVLGFSSQSLNPLNPDSTES